MQSPSPVTKEDQPRKMATNKIFIIFYSTSRLLAVLGATFWTSAESTERLVTASYHITPAGHLYLRIWHIILHSLCIEDVVWQSSRHQVMLLLPEGVVITHALTVSLVHSRYGHIYKMAQSVLKGVNSVEGVEGTLYQVSALLAEHRAVLRT